MDRNLILALAISMLVLSLYQSVFVVPRHKEMLKNTQVNAVKEYASIINSAAPSKTQKALESTKIDFKEERSKLTSTNYGLELSNVGGSLHNIIIGGDERTLPVENFIQISGFENAPFSLVSSENKVATYSFANTDWKIVKTYTINKDNTINARIDIKNLKSSSRVEAFSFKAFTINGNTIDTTKDRSTMLYEFSILQNGKVSRKGEAHKFNEKDNKTTQGKVDWVGFRGHYHAIIVKPLFETKSVESKLVSEGRLDVSFNTKEQDISSGSSATYEFKLVAGNQDIGWLASYKMDFDKIVAFSGWGIIDIFAKGVYYTIPVLQKICRSWGFSIILISLLIYGITYPLTMKSMKSMRKMQVLQPKIAAMQKRYKDDPKKLNEEMMLLYRTEGVNPLGGCLPFILQMPVFMALYQVLWRAYYFQGKGFLWIKDLALPDRLFILPFNLPFLGNELNILPIVMGSVMFLQQQFSTKNVVVTDETQLMQQKMMKYFFPIFIGFIFYKFASGLSLYFTVFYALSTWTQWRMANIK